MTRTRLDRRTVLRGAFGGAAVAIALPPLEIFFDSNGTAYAEGEGLPKRFGLWFWGNGIHPDRWTPTGEGTEWVLSEQLEPLLPVKDRITVVTGMNVRTGNHLPHASGPAGILSGAPLIVRGDDGTFSAPSIDQVIAAEIGRTTRFKSLELGVRPQSGLSYNGPDSKNRPEGSPQRLFERIFGGGLPEPGQPVRDPKLGLRRSVLDWVAKDVARLQGRLGASDRTRLDQHLAGVRELEQRIARIQEAPPRPAACAAPADPGTDPSDVEGRPQLAAINELMADLVAMALACDQTRVFSHWYSYPVNDVLFPGARAGHHQLTHDEPGAQPQVHSIVRTITADLARFIGKLAAIREGDATLLDHMVLFATSDVSFGRTHSIEDYPIVLAGTAGGAIRNGLHYRSASGENTSKVLLTLLRAMGVRRAEFGTGGGRVDQGLGAIEA